MPTNHTGNATATQAPSPPPTPGAAPIGSLPVDGDPDNAASVAQAFKVCLDFIAWLFSPRAVVASWAEAIMRYRDARLRSRFIVDHFGLPGGEYAAWREMFGLTTDWLRTTVGITTVVGTSGMSWDVAQDGLGTIGVNGPGILAGINFSDTHPVLTMTIANAGVETSEMILNNACPTACWSTNTLCSLDYNLQQHTVTDACWVHGLAGQGQHVNTINDGAFFIRANSVGATWHARVIQGGTATDVDTGVAGTADATHHYRIVVVGSAIDDSSTSRVLFFIDGTLVANITSNIPAVGAKMYPVWGGFTGGTAAPQTLLVGPPHWVQATRFETP